MNQRVALVFLILLRMAIGWHFLFEAIEKHRSIAIGETVTNKPWTSEGYFREGSGPIAKLVRSRLGDPDDLLLERLTVRPLSGGETAQTVVQQLPARLDREWDEYLDRFTKHYKLDADRQSQAREILQAQKERTVHWLTAEPFSTRWLLAGLWTDHDREPFKRTYPGGSYDVNVSISERVEEYRELVQEYRSLGGERLFTMGKDVEKSHRPAARSAMMAMRSELQSLLDQRTDEMQKALTDSVLTPDESKQTAAMPTLPRHWLIRLIDWSTRWGLLFVGIGLLFGLCSRTAALGGAMFLLMTLLTHPPFPWLPVPPNTEGNYVFISKNVIEMLALFMLACIPSGRWFGLDAFLGPIVDAINPFHKPEPTA